MRGQLRRGRLEGILLLGAAAAVAAPAWKSHAVPPLVFVSRNPLPPGAPRGVPGLGPRYRAVATGGRLMVRTARGQVRPLLARAPFFDVSDPCVSWDARRIVFAATVSPDSGWRIFAVGADGRGLAAVTRSDRALDLAPLGDDAPRFSRYDDLDPCWLPDGRVCFASTRYPQVAEQGGGPVTNLFVVDPDGGNLKRITSERNGAEEPTVDPASGRIVYTRWWFNRYLPSEDPSGTTTDSSRAVLRDPVDLWQAVSIHPDGDRVQLAGGNPRVRPETMAYQPLVMADGTLVGVSAERGSLLPPAGPLSIVAFRGGFGEPVHRAGGDRGGSACSPASLGDGRVVFAYDPGGSGDYGLYLLEPRARRTVRLVDLPGTLELDPAPLAPRRRPPVIPPAMPDLPHALPIADERQLRDSVNTFRFDCLNVFANAPLNAPIPDAPPLGQGLRIRFYATLSRPGAAEGDTVVLLREAPVDRDGAVHETELPADTPMFEQLIDAHGRVVRSASGPAHVPGFNSGRFGSGTKCVGCHIGHSVIPVARSAFEGSRFNASPSAEVVASSVAEGNAGPRAAVDRRTRGPLERVAWVARSARDEEVRLAWRSPIEVDTLVIYAIPPQSADGTDLRVQECEVAFFRDGREVRRDVLRREFAPSGTPIYCQGVKVDAIVVHPTRATGTVRHHVAVGLAEIETIARLPED